VSRICSLIEIFLVSIPFHLVLLWHHKFLEAILLLVASIVIVFTPGFNHPFTVPTPFYKLPYEFPRGFRLYMLMFLVLLFILIQGIKVDNFNLALSTLVMASLICAFFYSWRESEYFIRINVRSSAQFLVMKLRIAFFGYFILTFPWLVVIGFYFNSSYMIISAAYILGYILILTIIFAKYSAYPRDLQLPQIMLIGLGISIPPLMLIEWIWENYLVKMPCRI